MATIKETVLLLVERKLQAGGAGEGRWMVRECGHGIGGKTPGGRGTGAGQQTRVLGTGLRSTGALPSVGWKNVGRGAVAPDFSAGQR